MSCPTIDLNKFWWNLINTCLFISLYFLTAISSSVGLGSGTNASTVCTGLFKMIVGVLTTCHKQYT